MPELFPLPAQVFISLCVILVVLHLILLSTAYLIFLERKVASWAQDRIGPNRTDFSFGQDNLIVKVPLIGGLLSRLLVGPKALFGLGQALADGVKLLIKEDYTPPRVDKGLFLLAPILAVVPAMLGWAVIPWGGLWEFPGLSLFGVELAAAGTVSVTVAPLSIGAIFILAIGSLAVYGVALAGYASNNKFSFLGGLRATAQMLSYEIPMGVCVLIMILMYQSADLGLMTNLQAGGTGDGWLGGWLSLTSTWGIFAHPLLAVIFFTCILAECNRAPFDLAEAEQELVGGFHTEFGSMKWALFFLGEYIHMITGCAFFAVLFLGGWDPFPFVNVFPQVTEGFWEGLLVVLLKFGVLAGKVALLLFVMMWVRWTLPRFRYDQLMKLGWRSIIPLMLLMLLVVGTMVFLGVEDWWWYGAANVGVAVIGAVLSPRLPQGPAVNRKVGLAGSRFSPVVDPVTGTAG